VSARRSLITGITGQDGSYLADLLIGEGDTVIGTSRAPVPGAEVEVLVADLDEPAAFAAAVASARPDRIFHLAAPTFVPASWERPADTLRQIAGVTAELLRLDVPLLTVASPEIFGDAGESPQTERSPKRPRSPYGVAKLAAHELVRVMRDERGAHACSVITYNHESPRRPERFVTRKITRGAAAIRLGRLDELALGDLDAVRDWSDARDVVAGMALALDAPEPDDYVLASGVPRTVRDFVEAAFAAAGVDPEGRIRVDPQFVRPPEPTTLVGDPTRAREVLGWKPRRAFDELVCEMVETDLAELAGDT
jgi:GDPmannose 4,6-dehydratase